MRKSVTAGEARAIDRSISGAFRCRGVHRAAHFELYGIRVKTMAESGSAGPLGNRVMSPA